MRTVADAAPASAAGPRATTPAAPPRTRPFYWSVRRELWENRAIHLAPSGVGAFAVAALVVHAVAMPSHRPGMLAADPGSPGSASVTYAFAASLMLATAFFTGAFYSLEALGGERRDRSILFWKSLPVSDLTTVLAKASIPLVVLPLLTFAAIVAMQLVLLLLSAAALLAQGRSAAALWSELQLFRAWPATLYALAAMALWHAPIHAFLLLVSGWARRTAALWAVLPLLAAGVLEKLTLDTLRIAAWAEYRLLGWYAEAFAAGARGGAPFHPLAPLTPGRFLGAPGLWIGVAVAAAFLAAAVRLRRSQVPG
jgi:ABC-2 type transport system permease protein